MSLLKKATNTSSSPTHRGLKLNGKTHQQEMADQKQESQVSEKISQTPPRADGREAQDFHTRRVQHGGEQSGLPDNPVMEMMGSSIQEPELGDDWIEPHYVVFAVKDIEDALDPDEKTELIRLEEKIALHRTSKGKEPIDGLFIRSHWPIYPTVKALLKEWVLKVVNR